MSYNGTQQAEFLAPHSEDAEIGVLGSILLNPDIFFEVSQLIDGDTFYILRNCWIWEAINAIHARGEDVDNLSVVDELRKRGHLEDVGGSSYVTFLINNTVTSLHAMTYAQIMRRDYLRRRVLGLSGDLAKMATSGDMNWEQVIDTATRELFTLSNDEGDKNDVFSLGEALVDNDIQTRERNEKIIIKNGIRLEGHSSGMTDVDRIITGWKPDYLYTVTAPPGGNKTSFMMHCARMVAGSEPHPAVGSNVAVIFSMEMSETRLAQRLLAREMRMNSTKVRTLDFNAKEEAKYSKTLEKLGGLPIYLVDARGWSIDRIIRKCEHIRQQVGELGFIGIDYLGEIEDDNRRFSDSRAESIERIVRKCKTMTSVKRGKFQFGCPVMLLSQSNRETNKAGKPSLFGFSDSSGVEKSSDCAIGIYTGEDDPANSKRIAIMKHRDGATGECMVYLEESSYFWSDLDWKSTEDYA